jgi:hypothetical protein
MAKNRLQEQQERESTRVNEWLGKAMRPVVGFMSGSFLVKEDVLARLPYVLFLVGIGLVYITNGYMAEDTVRKINKASNDLKELRSEYITISSDWMYTTKQSELIRIIEDRELGLEESLEPPMKIVVTEDEQEEIADILDN